MAGKQEQRPFHERLAEKLIDQLKEGTAPWQKPWEAGEIDFLPVNAATGKRYKGVNAVALLAQGRDDNRWVTYKQAEAMGGQVRRGERGTGVIYWKFEDEQTLKDEAGRPVRDADGEIVKVRQKLERPRAFFATVFNAEQIDGLPPRPMPEPRPFENQARAEAIMANSGVKIIEAPGDRAYYRPSDDTVRLPVRSQFTSEAGFYATAMHELGHATGHPTRLDRNLSGGFGSESYAREELRAEIASMIVGSELGTGHDPGQHVAYVGSWIKALTEQPLEIMRACADAERIAEHVLAWEQVQQHQVTNAPGAQSIEEELRALSAAAVPSYDPRASWHNLRDHAHSLGLTAEIGRGDGPNTEGHEPPFVVRYWTAEGQQTGTITNLFHDGKALSMVEGERVPGTYYTEDLEWQRAALSGAVGIERARADERRGELEAAEHQRLSLAAARAEAAGEVGASDGQCRELAKAIITTGAEDTVLFGRNIGDNAGLTSDMAATALSAARRGALGAAPQAAAPEPSASRTYISAPYADRREVRRLGGEWDGEKRSWYVPPGAPLEPFRRWMTADGALKAAAAGAEAADKGERRAERTVADERPSRSGRAGVAPAPRTFIAVPFTERHEAKALGAKWDAAVKSWYAPADGDPKLTARWGTDRSKREAAAPSPENEFRAHLEGLGFELDGDPEMDGKRHRCRTVGDRQGEKSGFYVGFLDGRPAGYAKNNRTGEGGDWKSTGIVLSEEERARLRAEAATKLQAREAERREAAETVAKQCSAELAEMKPVTAETRYVHAKGIDAYPNAFEDRFGNTVVPAYDVEGRHWSNQVIRRHAKLFAKDGRKEGCFHVIGGQAGLASAPALVIAEGYATAATLTKALDFPVVAAFDAGNLKPVAEALAKAHPGKPIVIAGDDDHALELKHPFINRGRVAAEEAAQAVGGTAIIPLLTRQDREAGGTDFNDLDTQPGQAPGRARAQIEPLVRALIGERAAQRAAERIEREQQEPRTLERKPRSVRVGA